MEIWNANSSTELELSFVTPMTLQELIKQQIGYEENRSIVPVTYMGYYDTEADRFVDVWRVN